MEVFTLFLMGIMLIAFNVRAVSKEKNSFKTQLKNKEGSVNDLDLEVGKLRHEFGETIFELQNQIESLKNSNEAENKTEVKNEIQEKLTYNIENSNDNIEDAKNNIEDSNITEGNGLNKETHKFENYNNVKIDEIKKMLDDNVSIDNISETTGIAKGELLLIKELYIK